MKINQETNKEEALKAYVALANRIVTRLAQEHGDHEAFDEVSLSDIS